MDMAKYLPSIENLSFLPCSSPLQPHIFLLYQKGKAASKLASYMIDYAIPLKTGDVGSVSYPMLCRWCTISITKQQGAPYESLRIADGEGLAFCWWCSFHFRPFPAENLALILQGLPKGLEWSYRSSETVLLV